MLRIAIAGLSGLLFATSVIAQPSPQVRQACGVDAMRLCADAPQEKGARAKCMRQHWAELSSDCKSAIMARQAEMKARPDQGAPQQPR
jgi:hypothetical protein